MDVDMLPPIEAAPSGLAIDIARFPLKQRVGKILADFGYDPLTPRRINFLPQQTLDNLIRFTTTPSNDNHNSSPLAPPSTSFILQALSQTLSLPGCAFILVKHVRPLVPDLVARWLPKQSGEEKSQEEWERELFILGELGTVVPQLWNVIHRYISSSPFLAQTPLAFLPPNESITQTPSFRLHLLLLTYHRLLFSDPSLPHRNFWSHQPLLHLYKSHPDQGVRYLAIQCIVAHCNLSEQERLKLEKEFVGSSVEPGAWINYEWRVEVNENEGVTKLEMIEGWQLRLKEAYREYRFRDIEGENEEWEQPAEGQGITTSDVSEYTTILGGQIALRMEKPTTDEIIGKIMHVEIGSSQSALALTNQLLDLRLPILITSTPSGGKTHIIHHLSQTIYPATPIVSRILSISLADTSIDAKALIGNYVSSPTEPGTFTWVEGALTKAIRAGRWIILEDVDRANQEVLSLFARIADSMGRTKMIGGRARLDIPGRATVEAGEGFALFATRKVASIEHPSPALFLGHNFFREVILPAPSDEEVRSIMDAKYPRLAGPIVHTLSSAYQEIVTSELKMAKMAVPGSGAKRTYGLRDLEKWCARVERCLPSTGDLGLYLEPNSQTYQFSNPAVQDEVFLEAIDIFLASFPYHYPAHANRTNAIAEILGRVLGVGSERVGYLLEKRVPQVEVVGDARARQSSRMRIGRVSLHGLAPRPEGHKDGARPFAMTKPSAILLERTAVGVSLGEPLLLVGETGTGKTTAVQHIAAELNRPLTVINLSTQTESADLLGGFRPVDAAVPARSLQTRWVELFRRSFSRKKNEKYEEGLRKALIGSRWKRVVEMWTEAGKLAQNRLHKRLKEKTGDDQATAPPAAQDRPDDNGPRKKRKVADDDLTAGEIRNLLMEWTKLDRDIETFNMQHVVSGGKLVFAFVEGPLVQAMSKGEWILLDEVNLASQETLESLAAIVEHTNSSVVLTERGDLEAVQRHPEFRLFACMNPATDVGKKDLPPSLRMRFTEIYSPPPDDDRDALIAIVKQYIGDAMGGDRSAVLDVAEFYMAMKALSKSREIVDGTNTPPHFSMRTLARALTWAVEAGPSFGFRRAVYEGCLMTFTMSLDAASLAIAEALCMKHLLSGHRNPKALLRQQPTVPAGRDQDDYVRFGHYWLEKGPEPITQDDQYVITPSVQKKLADMARIILTRKLPVLIQGPTSAGKTSSIEYLAKQTGHRFVRINNHEHTDIQEYLGTYASDPASGLLKFREGLLVTAIRRGDWLVLDELNLAPTDVLEALNRLLDDNRELVLPETGEVLRPHPHFMLFATQNPPGLYAGRKVLSRAFRNRFLEVHFDDVPQDELQTIICQRCAVAPSYALKIVQVFQELQHRRQAARMFESRDSYATLRDLFRWAGRDAMSYQDLANNGYMLLAERARLEEDKVVVKEVIQDLLKVQITPNALYTANGDNSAVPQRLGLTTQPSTSKNIAWTSAMRRLYTLVATATHFGEPVLLVGETGAGKTSVCEVLAEALGRNMFSISCHQNMETADVIGSQRPIRDRAARLSAALSKLQAAASQTNGAPFPDPVHLTTSWMLQSLSTFRAGIGSLAATTLAEIEVEIKQCEALFEWHDGPLVHAMQEGGVLLLDELSLADDSVLERLNSVLEPSKTLVLAEKGGSDASVVVAKPGFQIIATMNPGGDFGKKELSPALRNRFTEIWVPSITDVNDLHLILDRSWAYPELAACTSPLVAFYQWFSEEIVNHNQSGIGLRDLLAWVTFTNSCFSRLSMPVPDIFTHAANMIMLDGLEVLPGLAGLDGDKLSAVRHQVLQQIDDLSTSAFGRPSTAFEHPAVTSTTESFGLGPFIVAKTTADADLARLPFAMDAPTTLDNLLRVLRACQLPKAILLEGSPGVGKTTLIQALSDACGRQLRRINLSDQTDLIDLFGSDLPVVGGRAGEFAWQDAAFLKSMRNGDWVLLDEMNLASQAILEGLNAVLDHRGTVFIPELGRSFEKHPEFRIFAAQNPVHQGGGRKGLPKSFLNRFTKVYVREHTRRDLEIICGRLYADVPVDVRGALITFNEEIQQSVNVLRRFGLDGRPWEFNLRDITRCFQLYTEGNSESGFRQMARAIATVYQARFRSTEDKEQVALIYEQVFGTAFVSCASRLFETSADSIAINGAAIGRTTASVPPQWQLQMKASALSSLDSVMQAITAGWLAILVGPVGSGKRSLVRWLAGVAGRTLEEYSMQPAVDTLEMLGSFEQSDHSRHVARLLDEILQAVPWHLTTSDDNIGVAYQYLQRFVGSPRGGDVAGALRAVQVVLPALQGHAPATALAAWQEEVTSVETASGASSFEWVDGPLVNALKSGGWFFINDANLCSSSVLDRLNSLCEPQGCLILNERGTADQSQQVIVPHPDFRLFLSFDPRNGELSRAMRNRGIEVGFTSDLRSGSDTSIGNPCFALSQYERSAQLEASALRILHEPDRQRGNSLDWDYIGRIAELLLRSVHNFGSDVLPLFRMIDGSPATPFIAAALQRLQAWSRNALQTSVDPRSLASTAGQPCPSQSLPAPISTSVGYEYLATTVAANLYLPATNVTGEDIAINNLNALHAVIGNIIDSVEVCRAVETSVEHESVLRQLDLLLSVMLLSQTCMQQPQLDVAFIGALMRRLRNTGVFIRSWPSLLSATDKVAVWSEATTGLRQDAIWRSFTLLAPVIRSRDAAIIAIQRRVDEQSDLFVTSLIGVGDNVFERESDAEDRLTSLLRAISTLPDITAVKGTTKLVRSLYSVQLRMLYNSLQSKKVEDATFRRYVSAMSDNSIPFLPIAVCLAHLRTQNPENKLDAVSGWMVVQDMLRQYASPFAAEGKELAIAELARPVDLQGVLNLRMRQSLKFGDLEANKGDIKRAIKAWQVSSLNPSPSLDILSANLAFFVLAKVLKDATGESLTKLDLVQVLQTSQSTSERLANLQRLLDRADAGLVAREYKRIVGSGHFDAGALWLRVALLLVVLYVPDVAADPAVEEECERQLAQHRSRRLAGLLEVRRSVESLGEAQTNAIPSVEPSDSPSSDEVVHHNQDEYQRRAADIPAFYNEVHRFFSSVHGEAAMLQLETQVKEGGDLNHDAHANFQAASDAFLARMADAYPHLSDLMAPMEVAVRSAKMGLSLSHRQTQMAAAQRSTAFTHATLAKLSAYPIMSASSALIELQLSHAVTISRDSAAQSLLGLETCAYRVASGVKPSADIGAITRAYNALIALWLADQTAAKRAQQVSESLYRAKTTSFDDLPDAEREAQELLDLFPVYNQDEAEPGEALLDEPALNKSVVTTFLKWEAIARTYELHNELFTRGGGDNTLSRFEAERIEALSDKVDLVIDGCNDEIDASSRPIQLAVLAEEAAGMTSKATSYNFYKSANAPQLSRALDLLLRLQCRVEFISEEYPDQMVLQHLLDRCNNIRNMSAASPVPRMLAALEQLLTHTEDWQAYASRDTSLKAYQEEIIAMIISWRRLELENWAMLLDQEAEAYRADTAEWWFRLYQLLVVGLTHSEAGGTDGESSQRHLHQTIPLVQQFMNEATLGQFESRLGLVDSFAAYLSTSVGSIDPEIRLSTVRALHSLHRHFRQHSFAVAAAIKRQREPLDKSIKDFIKLASWKDVNIEAMRASARKTHAQLYKAVRKMREILRQSAAPIFAQASAGVPKVEGLPAGHPVEQPIELYALSAVLPDDLEPGYMANLPRTYAKYSSIMSSPAISAHTVDATTTLDDLVETITETVTAFRQETPSALTEKNKKNVANLQTRKRKAFADLLKELRQLGFSAHTPATQLTNQSSISWLSNLTGLATVLPAAQDEDDTLHRALASADQRHHCLDLYLPAMRDSLRNHSEDFVTHDLQRAFGFAENVFASALSTRSRLLPLLEDLGALETTAESMQRFFEDAPALGGLRSLELVQRVHDTLVEISAAMQEGLQMLRRMDKLDIADSESRAVAQTLQDILSSVKEYIVKLGGILSGLTRSNWFILTQGDVQELGRVRDSLRSARDLLANASRQRSNLDFMLVPLRDLIGRLQIDMPVPRPVDSVDIARTSKAVLDILLVAAQNQPQHSREAEEADRAKASVPRAVATEFKQVSDGLRGSQLRQRLADLQRAIVVDDRNGQVASDIAPSLAYLLPFLQTHINTVRTTLYNATRLLYSEYGLCLTLASLFRELAQKGYCKPAEEDDGKSEPQNDANDADGTGIGAGSGSKNVSDEIQEESQVEGVQEEEADADEEEGDKGSDRDEDDDAIEMEDDFQGKTQDVDNERDEEGSEGDEEEENADLDEKIEDTGDQAVDDKFWDEPQQDDEQDAGQDRQDDQQQPAGEEEDLRGKEDDKDKKSAKKQEEPSDDAPVDETPEEDQGAEDADAEDQDQASESADPVKEDGVQMDEHLPEGDILDLPEDMQIDPEDASVNGDDDDRAEEEQSEDGAEVDSDADNMRSDDGSDADGEANEAGSEMDVDENDEQEGEVVEQDNNVSAEPNADDPSDSRPDNGSGTNNAPRSAPIPQETSADMEERNAETAKPEEDPQDRQANTADQPRGANDSAEQMAAQGGEVEPQSSTGDPADRSKGDTLKDIHRMVNDILSRSDAPREEQAGAGSEQAAKQVEHVREDEASEMQALGAADAEEHQRLADLAIIDDQDEAALADRMDVDEDDRLEEPVQATSDQPMSRFAGDRSAEDEAKALTQQQIQSGVDGSGAPGEDASMEDVDDVADLAEGVKRELDDDKEHEVEQTLQDWNASERKSVSGAEVWRQYSTLTSDLSYQLCEQLRLILQPTLATRLQGDYRTGKRLNMRKIIPYIASEYTKDKIWLRRTKPSRREYQVLLSLDDSRSMADSRSVHLAYQTLALVSQALTKLEVGQVGIARFGEEMDLLHPFGNQPFSDAEGAKVLEAFTFRQHRTDVAKLLSESLDVLSEARQTQTSSSSGDLWQLQIIISDGVCQDHPSLRKLLRKALQDRVMIVFLVIDSLQQGGGPVNGSEVAKTARSSILNMQSVAYKEVNGEMKIEMERYLDTFPFEYYVVLRDVDALPQVLSETLRQWMTRVSASEE